MTKVLTIEISAVFDKLKSALGTIGKLFKEAFKFEKANIQFKYLLGNIELAKKHVAELRQMGMSGAFGFDELAEASKTLIKFSDGALSGTQTLTRLADAAAATNTPLEQMAKLYARFYDTIANQGDPTKIITQMEKTGLISVDISNQLKEMAKAGVPAIQMWDKLTEALKKFEGVNDELTNTKGGALDYLVNKAWDKGTKAAEEFIGQVDRSTGAAETVIDKLLNPLVWAGQVLGRIVGVTQGAIIPSSQLESKVIPPTEDTARQALIASAPDEVVEATRKMEEEEDEENRKYAEFVLHTIEMEAEAEDARVDAVKRLNAEYRQQKSLVKSIESSIISYTKALNQGYAGSLTATGKIGGYQSLAEASLATKMPGQDPQLQELVKQTSLLTQIRDNAKTSWGLTL